VCTAVPVRHNVYNSAVTGWFNLQQTARAAKDEPSSSRAPRGAHFRGNEVAHDCRRICRRKAAAQIIRIKRGGIMRLWHLGLYGGGLRHVDTPGSGIKGSPSAALLAAPDEKRACIVWARDKLQRKEGSTLHVSQPTKPTLRPLP
jgi:hypothetical protein